MNAGIHAGDWRTTLAAPPHEIEPLTPAELHELLRGGEVEADLCERGLVTAARVQAAIDFAIGEGLLALRHGDRLPQLGCHLDDYAREVLGIGKRTAQNITRLARELRTRPILHGALRSGRIRIRAAETILPVAVGDAEALWVARAMRATVRDLEVAVRRARNGCGEEEDWFALRTQLPPDDRALIDAALDLAGELMQGMHRSPNTDPLARNPAPETQPGRSQVAPPRPPPLLERPSP